MRAGKKIVSILGSGGAPYNASKEKEGNVIGRKIAMMRRSVGISLADMSTILSSYGVNVTASSISKWETGETVPNSYQLLAVCHAMDITDSLKCFTSRYQPELNSAGQKKLVEYKQLLIASGLYAPEPDLGEIIELPVSYLRVSAGGGQELLDENMFENHMFPKSQVPQGADFAVYVGGNSMEPVYHDGQIVFVQKKERLHIGDVGIFAYDGEGYIKVYNEQKTLSHHGDSAVEEIQPVLMSYNCKYAPIPIMKNRPFSVFGKVLS